MDTQLLARAQAHAPQWLRYLLALSEIAASGQGWVVAADDDVALFDADDATFMPLWPTAELAAENDIEGGEPTPVPVPELVEQLLPAMGDEFLVAVFPGEGDNTLVGAADVARDIQGFSESPRDVEGEILAPPHAVVLDDLAMLEAPDMAAFAASRPDEAAYWLLTDDEGMAVALVEGNDAPALLLFPDESHATAFQARTDAPASPVPVSAEALVGGWLLLAFSAGWGVATLEDAGTASVVAPVRLALEIAEGAGA